MSANKPLQTYGWIASLYFFQSLPYMVVATIAALCYQHYGLRNATATLFTSLFMLPWCIKPVFAPLFEKTVNRKAWLLTLQTGIGLVFFILALSANISFFLPVTVLAFLCLACLSSMNDILSDGLYLQHLSQDEQTRYVGLRTCFYQLGRLTVKGGLLALAACVAARTSVNVWSLFFSLLTLLILALILFHYWILPAANGRIPVTTEKYRRVVSALLGQNQWHAPLFFIFIYNITDAQSQKILPLFLVDPQGIGLSLPQLGGLYGIVGGLALVSGISLAGYLSSRWGAVYCLKKFTVFMIPCHFFFFLITQIRPAPALVFIVVLQGQLLTGLMNGAYMTYLLLMANQSPYPMSMYTLCTSIMALSYIVFGALSGVLQTLLGYRGFFLTMLLGSGVLLLITCRTLNKPLPRFSDKFMGDLRQDQQFLLD